ncbi:MAG TPA: molybdenum cofactor biosynthesis protein MoaE [Bacteroidales bacterium]|nr:molybdenum cofactor biosynthesis protein MoaE [Bacteroidales bacterium]
MVTDYLTNGPITQKIIAFFIERMGDRTDSGGHSVFLGQVRADEINGKRVKAIEYSAYEAMVKVEADKIKVKILSEYVDVKSVDIVHSTGIVNVGEISLLVFVSAGHRQQAIEACGKSVELIKEKLPVWKKEIFDDDTHEWRQNSSV